MYTTTLITALKIGILQTFFQTRVIMSPYGEELVLMEDTRIPRTVTSAGKRVFYTPYQLIHKQILETIDWPF